MLITAGPDAVNYIVNHADVQAIFCLPQTLDIVSFIAHFGTYVFSSENHAKPCCTSSDKGNYKDKTLIIDLYSLLFALELLLLSGCQKGEMSKLFNTFFPVLMPKISIEL